MLAARLPRCGHKRTSALSVRNARSQADACNLDLPSPIHTNSTAANPPSVGVRTTLHLSGDDPKQQAHTTPQSAGRHRPRPYTSNCPTLQDTHTHSSHAASHNAAQREHQKPQTSALILELCVEIPRKSGEIVDGFRVLARAIYADTAPGTPISTILGGVWGA